MRKDNQINLLQKKVGGKPNSSSNTTMNNSSNNFYNDTKENEKNNEREKEIYIIEPSTAVNQIHDELLLYKDIYKKLSRNIKDIRYSLSKYEKISHELEIENAKFRQELKFAQNNNITTIHNKEPSTPKTIINHQISNTKSLEGVKEYLSTYNNPSYSPHGIPLKTSPHSPVVLKTDKTAINNKLSFLNNRGKSNSQIIKITEDYLENQLTANREKVDNTEEWVDALKHCNMNQEEFVRLSRNKVYAKLIDVIEFLYKLILDKNLQIRLLINENENLNVNNVQLNKENIVYTEQNKSLIGKINTIKETKEKLYKKGDTGMDSSMNNNTSRLTVNNTIQVDDNYLKKLNKKQSSTGNKHIESESEFRDNSELDRDSQTGSQIYTHSRTHKTPQFKDRVNTIESITSSEFREEIIMNGSNFNTDGDIEDINIKSDN